MTPPDNWKWADGKILHIDMKEKLARDLKHLVDGYRKENKNFKLYFHELNSQVETTDWEDYNFNWLDDHEDNTFHSPGPSLAKRREQISLLEFFMID
jgi:hypothetical protein